jgi:hypothetical protein
MAVDIPLKDAKTLTIRMKVSIEAIAKLLPFPVDKPSFYSKVVHGSLGYQIFYRRSITTIYIFDG